MNDNAPRDPGTRCPGPGTTCRLVQLETPGPRPVWAVLDAAGLRRFTGELTLASQPVVRAYFLDGGVYYAEREGDPSIADRLIEYGVATVEQIDAGTVRLGSVAHLGRLFDRVPAIERDPVELVLEVLTGEVLGEIADHTVDSISIASYRHHSSGVWKWRRPSAFTTDDDPVPTAEVAVTVAARPTEDMAPTAEDHDLVAEYEQLMRVAPPATEPASLPTQPLELPDALAVPEPPADRPAALRPPPRFATPVVPQPVVPQPLLAQPTLPAPANTGPVPTAAPAPIAVSVPALDDPIDGPVDHPATDVDDLATAPPVAANAPADAPAETSPFTFSFDLDEVLAQVVRENDGLPVTHDDDIDESVRAAVREALAEIEAATRPPVSSGLSATAFEVALSMAPDTPADIEPAAATADEAPAPWLSDASPHLGTPASAPAPDTSEAGIDASTSSDEAPTDPGTPALGLRRLIGGPRKP